MEDDEELLDGPTRMELQINNGVRTIVEDLDNIRVAFNLDGTILKTLTPKVETRLRRGFRPLVPMRVRYDLGATASLLITFPIIDYPSRPISVSVIDPQNGSIADPLLQEVEEQLRSFCIEAVGNSGYACQLINNFQDLILAKYVDNQPTNENNNMILNESNQDINDHIFVFTCKHCRTILFDNTYLQSHNNDEIIDNITTANSSNTDCTSWFLQEPMEWMLCSDISGKLLCPQCKGKLGSWNWSGCKCSCGQWITPAFQFQRSKLDAKDLTNTSIIPSHK
eukprot:gene12197-25626_t